MPLQKWGLKRIYHSTKQNASYFLPTFQGLQRVPARAARLAAVAEAMPPRPRRPCRPPPRFNFLFSHNGNLTPRGYGIFTAEPHQDLIRRFISHHQLQPLFHIPPILSFSSFGIFPASFLPKKFCLKPRSPGIPIRQISSSHSDTFLSKSEKQELKVNIILNCLFITFWKTKD